jgi:pimeloyl-ACP methyl ester carboxylesterase
MWDAVSALDLLIAAPALQMPVFFFLGRRDHWVPPETSVAYFDVLSAPSKELLWFDRFGHEPFVDEPAKFTRAVADMVRPLVAQ